MEEGAVLPGVGLGVPGVMHRQVADTGPVGDVPCPRLPLSKLPPQTYFCVFICEVSTGGFVSSPLCP